VFWFLLAVVLLLSLALLAVTLLRLWRRVVGLGRQVTAAAEAAEGLTAAAGAVGAGRSSGTCPTCGGPQPPVTASTPARSR
jgi:hypothetical protein